MNTKKSVGGLEFLRVFMIGLAVVVVLAFALSIMAGGMGTALLTTGTATMNDQWINSTGVTLSQSSLVGFTNPSLVIVNASNGAKILSGNWTVASNVITNATTTVWTDVNITYSYLYASSGTGYGIIGNFSNGLVSLGSNVSTWITLASLVVIIGIIGVVIYLVSKFGGNSELNQ